MGFSLVGVQSIAFLSRIERIIGTLCLSGVLACGELLPKPPAIEPAEVLVGGCRVLQQSTSGKVCLSSALSATVFWIAGRECDSIELVENGAPISVKSEWVNDGCQLQPTMPSATQISTYMLRERGSQNIVWSLSVDRSKPWLLELTDRMWLRAPPDLQGASSESPIDQLTQDDRNIQLLRIDKSFAKAVVLIRQGKIDESLRALAETQELAASAGFPSIALDVAFRRMTMLRYAGLPEEASLVLEDAKPLLVAGHAWPQGMLAWNEGLNLRAQEHLEEAEKQVHRAVMTAQRVHDIGTLQTFMPMWADLLMALGQDQEAHQVIESVPLDNIDPRRTANVLASLGELELQMQQMRPRVIGIQVGERSSAEALLLRALEERQKVTVETSETELHFGLALVAFLDGRREQAKLELVKVQKSESLTNLQQMEHLELQARIAIDDGQLKAAAGFLAQLEELSKRYINNQHHLFACKIVVGRLELQQKYLENTPAMSEEALNCISGKVVLARYHRLALIQRLHDAGIN